MRKISKCAKVPKKLLATLNAIPDTNKPTEWGRQTNDVESFKGHVMSHGLTTQDHRCAWCSLLVGAKGRRTPHRDHIAPKDTYPQWTFTPLNIAISCEYCNGFLVKKTLDTVRRSEIKYGDSDFYIVHPYLDEPAHHIALDSIDKYHGVLIRGKTLKGLWTIQKLKLDNPDMTFERIKEQIFIDSLISLPVDLQGKILKATGRV